MRSGVVGSVLGLAFALGLGPPVALAAQLVTLKPEVSSGPSVTLGDLFDGAGGEAAVIVGNGAPAGQSAVLDAGVVRQVASQHGLVWDNPDGLQRIVVPRVGGAAAAGARMTEVLTWTHSLQAGEMVQPDDLTFGKVATFAVPMDAPRDAEQVIGKVARRPLRGGSAVATHDVASPQVIKAGDTVALNYNFNGVSLTMQGQATTSAALGDPVTVVNPTSKKLIQAIASGADEAMVGPGADQFRNRGGGLSAAQIAALR